ncbi:hypothetical protein V6N13_083597 [Hibiscus sabdariffa]
MTVVLRDGSIASIGVFVPWMPVRFFHCKLFGHHDKSCSKQVVHSVGDDSFKKKVAHAEGASRRNEEAVWVPKKVSMVHVQGKCSDERVNSVVGDVSVTDDNVKASLRTSGAGNDDSGQAVEHVARQPREATKAAARIFQDLKAKKQNKDGAKKHNKGFGCYGSLLYQ